MFGTAEDVTAIDAGPWLAGIDANHRCRGPRED
jgi:hypothetical protein